MSGRVAIVAAPTLPSSFEDVELLEVSSGPLLCASRGHALIEYVSSPSVLDRISKMLETVGTPIVPTARHEDGPHVSSRESVERPRASAAAT